MSFITNCCRRSKTSSIFRAQTTPLKQSNEVEKKVSEEAVKAFLVAEEEISKNWERYYTAPKKTEIQIEERVSEKEKQIEEGGYKHKHKAVISIFFTIFGFIMLDKLAKFGGKSQLTGYSKGVSTSSENNTFDPSSYF